MIFNSNKQNKVNRLINYNQLNRINLINHLLNSGYNKEITIKRFLTLIVNHNISKRRNVIIVLK